MSLPPLDCNSRTALAICIVQFNKKKNAALFFFFTHTMTYYGIWNTKYQPKMKLSGRNSWPNGPDRTESIVPGSKSKRIALGTYFPPIRKKEIS